ncbi:RES family NAD+ phosphorylase [Pseudomonas oryzihabitans]|uniref:RES family NAD+ phosphorylase n=1 Tax=Pseudomonas oryzihabitans TaxID=47885 RepID=UPI003D07815C
MRFELHIEPPTWVLADLVRAHGHCGILFPSLVQPGGTNVVLYPDLLGERQSLRVLDPDGRLPRDQSSWTP